MSDTDVPGGLPVVRRSPTLPSFLLFALLFGALFACEIYVFFLRADGVPMTEAGDRPRLVGEVAGDTRVAQTFAVAAGGLTGVTVEARPSAGQVSGDAVFIVREAEAATTTEGAGTRPDAYAWRDVARVTAPLREVVADGSYRIAFAPIDGSADRTYQLVITAPGVPRGQGLALTATRDQAYVGGVLTVDGVEQWGDLVFRAHATRETLFRRLGHVLRDQPAWLRSPVTLAALMLLYNWALAAFTWYLLFVEDDAPAAPRRLSGASASPAAEG